MSYYNLADLSAVDISTYAPTHNEIVGLWAKVKNSEIDAKNKQALLTYLQGVDQYWDRDRAKSNGPVLLKNKLQYVVDKLMALATFKAEEKAWVQSWWLNVGQSLSTAGQYYVGPVIKEISESIKGAVSNILPQTGENLKKSFSDIWDDIKYPVMITGGALVVLIGIGYFMSRRKKQKEEGGKYVFHEQ